MQLRFLVVGCLEVMIGYIRTGNTVKRVLVIRAPAAIENIGKTQD